MSEVLHLDTELARKADRLYRELGLDLTTAIHLFLHQSLRDNGLPFTPRLNAPLPAGQEADAPAADAPSADVSAAEAPAMESSPAAEAPVNAGPAPAEELEQRWGDLVSLLTGEAAGSADERDEEDSAQDAQDIEAEEPHAPFMEQPSAPERPEPSSGAEPSGFAHAGGQDSELRQTFLRAGILGAPLRRIRSLNRIYAIGEANPHVQGWREVYLSGDEPFALDFGTVRLELDFREGGRLRMMDGRLPDDVLEADAVFPRDLSAVFSAAIGQPLTDVTSARVRRGGEETEQLRLHFANGCCLCFAPGGDWGAMWLADARGSVMFAPDSVWRRVLGDRAWQAMR